MISCVGHVRKLFFEIKKGQAAHSRALAFYTQLFWRVTWAKCSSNVISIGVNSRKITVIYR